VKLYTRYKEVIDTLRTEGKLTSYILPALVGNPPRPVKSMGFEALYQKILQNNIDVRFFYDHRAIDLSESKKTTVQFCPVDPRSLEQQYGQPFGRGVFHPKIIFLQNEKETSWLFTSSANLNVSGWSRNREAVIDREVRSSKNLKRIIDFFNTIAGKRLIDDSSLPESSGREEWDFIHSFEEDSFLERLLLDHPDILYIWSPYFAEDIQGLLASKIIPLMAEDPEIGIIPDIENGKIRIPSDRKQSLQSFPSVKFYQDDSKHKAQGDEWMNHAKVWLTKTHLAVGSWNLTESALHHGSNNGTCNVEAGIITPIDPATYRRLKPTKLLDLDKIDFMSTAELDRDRRFLMKQLPFEIQVFRDWKNDRYEISISGKRPKAEYTIRLPGVDHDCRLTFFY